LSLAGGKSVRSQRDAGPVTPPPTAPNSGQLTAHDNKRPTADASCRVVQGMRRVAGSQPCISGQGIFSCFRLSVYNDQV